MGMWLYHSLITVILQPGCARCPHIWQGKGLVKGPLQGYTKIQRAGSGQRGREIFRSCLGRVGLSNPGIPFLHCRAPPEKALHLIRSHTRCPGSRAGTEAHRPTAFSSRWTESPTGQDWRWSRLCASRCRCPSPQLKPSAPSCLPSWPTVDPAPYLVHTAEGEVILWGR